MQTLNPGKPQTPYKTFVYWLGWFLLSNTAAYWLIGLYYVNWIIPTHYDAYNTFNAGLVWAFIIFTWLGHFALLAFLPGIPLFLLGFTKLRQGSINLIASITSATALFLLIIDSLIFAQYRFHLNGIFWEMFINGASNQIFNFSTKEISLAIIAYVFLFSGELLLASFLWKKLSCLKNIKHQTYLYGIPGTSLFLSYMMFLMSAAQPVYSSISQHPQAFPLYTYLLSKFLFTENGIEMLETVGSNQFRQPKKAIAQLQYPLKPLICQAPKKPLNILFIVIDAWRYDMVDKAVTPNIYQFAQHTLQFRNHYSGGNSTQPGIFSLFYAIPATYWSSFLQSQQGPVFIHELIKHHYQMKILGSAPLYMPPFNKTVFSEVAHLKVETPGDDALLRDKNITNDFIHFLPQAKASAKPFFGFLFYDASHSSCNIKHLIGPFQPMVKECNRVLLSKKTDPTPLFNRYKNALYTVDQNIGQVLTALSKQALLNNTLIVITGDHGEEFNDNKTGYWGHSSNFTHFQVQTPLLIFWPHRMPEIFSHQTTHFDIVPTLLSNLFDCTNPVKDYSMGKDLFSRVHNNYLLISSYISYGIIDKNKITTIYPTGNYKIEDTHGNRLGNASLDFKTLQQAIDAMKYFYRTDKAYGT